MPELTSMMNIGKEMEKKLTSVGIESSEKLISTEYHQYKTAAARIRGRNDNRKNRQVFRNLTILFL